MEQGRASARRDGLEERGREEGGKERERRALATHVQEVFANGYC